MEMEEGKWAEKPIRAITAVQSAAIALPGMNLDFAQTPEQSAFKPGRTQWFGGGEIY